jgi:hypothetical protein
MQLRGDEKGEGTKAAKVFLFFAAFSLFCFPLPFAMRPDIKNVRCLPGDHSHLKAYNYDVKLTIPLERRLRICPLDSNIYE